MKTKNDREFCNLLACSRKVPIQKIPYFVYLMQAAGFDLRYRYSIKLDRIKSHGLISSLGDLVSNGYATNKYEVTERGREVLANMAITNEDCILCDDVLLYVETFDVEQLYFLCVVDIIVQGELNSGGYECLIKYKEDIVKTVKSLVKEFSYDDFDYSVGVFRKLRK